MGATRRPLKPGLKHAGPHRGIEGTTLQVSTLDLWRDVVVRGWIIYNTVMPSAEKSRVVASEVLPMVKNGVIRVATRERWPLEDFKKAMELAEQSGGAKKILLVSH